VEKLGAPLPAQSPVTLEELRAEREMPSLEPFSNTTEERFHDMVKRAREYIQAGDIFQVVLSQRFTLPLRACPLQLYRFLRVINPSPYLFFMRRGARILIGSSPEILVRLDDREVVVRPIAGTKPRGTTPEQDLQIERELLADPKELAEHIMLVDLGRNDVGRVAELGSVKVDELHTIERYSHVMHIVSSVSGRLREGCDAVDVLRASFPAGTLSGAPKVRAMEIIEELEAERRGLYGGAVGYIDFRGNMDMCIAIRSMLIQDQKLYVQAGAGIVADSDSKSEYEETLHKAGAVIRAIELAGGGSLS
jgi:anthranilate synthase component I